MPQPISSCILSFTLIFLVWDISTIDAQNTTQPASTSSILTAAPTGITACASVSKSLSICDVFSPGVTSSAFISQAPCLCYNANFTFQPGKFDAPFSNCVSYLSAQNPESSSFYNGINPTPCASVGDVVARINSTSPITSNSTDTRIASSTSLASPASSASSTPLTSSASTLTTSQLSVASSTIPSPSIQTLSPPTSAAERGLVVMVSGNMQVLQGRADRRLLRPAPDFSDYL